MLAHDNRVARVTCQQRVYHGIANQWRLASHINSKDDSTLTGFRCVDEPIAGLDVTFPAGQKNKTSETLALELGLPITSSLPSCSCLKSHRFTNHLPEFQNTSPRARPTHEPGSSAMPWKAVSLNLITQHQFFVAERGSNHRSMRSIEHQAGVMPVALLRLTERSPA